MRYEYDPNKSQTNKVKHGIDFEEARELWDDPNALMIAVDRPGEARHIVIGMICGLHGTALITFRGEAVRIISVRRSRETERTLYEQP